MTLNSSKELRSVIKDKDTSGGNVKGQGTGAVPNATIVLQLTRLLKYIWMAVSAAPVRLRLNLERVQESLFFFFFYAEKCE